MTSFKNANVSCVSEFICSLYNSTLQVSTLTVKLQSAFYWQAFSLPLGLGLEPKASDLVGSTLNCSFICIGFHFKIQDKDGIFFSPVPQGAIHSLKTEVL